LGKRVSIIRIIGGNGRSHETFSGFQRGRNLGKKNDIRERKIFISKYLSRKRKGTELRGKGSKERARGGGKPRVAVKEPGKLHNYGTGSWKKGGRSGREARRLIVSRLTYNS